MDSGGSGATKSGAKNEGPLVDSDDSGEVTSPTKSGSKNEGPLVDSGGSGEVTPLTKNEGLVSDGIPAVLNVSYVEAATEALTTILEKKDVTFLNNVGKGHCLIFAFLQGEFRFKCKQSFSYTKISLMLFVF